MPPQIQIAIQPGVLPCNISDVITEYVNLTSRLPEADEKPYDHVGAMEFIVATLLVYCLLGISGLLVMRIKRRASRSHRTVTLREEYIQEYIKQADELRMSGYREKLKMETKRMMYHIQNIELQKNESGGRHKHDLPHVGSVAMFDTSGAGKSVRTSDGDSCMTIISPYQHDVTQLPPLQEDYVDLHSLDEGVVTSSEYAPSGGTTSDVSGIHFGTSRVNYSETSLLSREFLRHVSNNLQIPITFNNDEDSDSSRSVEEDKNFNEDVLDDSDTNFDNVCNDDEDEDDDERNCEHLLPTNIQKQVNFS